MLIRISRASTVAVACVEFVSWGIIGAPTVVALDNSVGALAIAGIFALPSGHESIEERQAIRTGVCR
jgi:hypothetical protein